MKNKEQILKEQIKHQLKWSQHMHKAHILTPFRRELIQLILLEKFRLIPHFKNKNYVKYSFGVGDENTSIGLYNMESSQDEQIEEMLFVLDNSLKEKDYHIDHPKTYVDLGFYLYMITENNDSYYWHNPTKQSQLIKIPLKSASFKTATKIIQTFADTGLKPTIHISPQIGKSLSLEDLFVYDTYGNTYSNNNCPKHYHDLIPTIRPN